MLCSLYRYIGRRGKRSEPEIYRQIAKKHGVSVAEVKRDMQEAIDAAYQNPNAAALAVPRKGDVPTPDEFIAHVVKKVQDEGGGQG